VSGNTRAEACSDAIHKALFPRADAIHRMENSRRQIAEIIREHFPEEDWQPIEPSHWKKRPNGP